MLKARSFILKLIFCAVMIDANLEVYASVRDSVTFKSSFYMTTRPITDALLAPNIQIGFRTSDFKNTSRNQYLQCGFTYGNYAFFSSRRMFYADPNKEFKQYSAEMDYRFLFRKNKFWSPHLQLTYLNSGYDRYLNVNNLTGLIYELGFQNGRIFHKPGKSMMNSINWGFGVLQHHWQSPNMQSRYEYRALIIYLNWQFGQKSEK